MEKPSECEAVVRGENKPGGEIVSLAMCGMCDVFAILGQLEQRGLSREKALEEFRAEFCEKSDESDL